MIKLYYAPFTRSHLVRFLLEEAELPYEILPVDVRKGEHKSAEYMKVQPLGLLPAVEEDGRVTYECGAIVLDLADRAAPGKLAPRVGTAPRAAYYQWVLFAFATELFALSKIAMHTRFLPEAARQPAIAEEGLRAWPDVEKVIGRAVADRRWLLGDEFTAADVVVGGSLWLARFIGVLGDDPALRGYYGRITERKGFMKGFAEALA